MDVGEWTERPLLATRAALGLDPDTPEPETVWHKLTEDGQRLELRVWGRGDPQAPYVLELRCYGLEEAELEPGQDPGPVRWPTFAEATEAAQVVTDGAVFQLPPVVAGQQHAEPQRWTSLQLRQVVAIKGTPAAERYVRSADRSEIEEIMKGGRA